MEQILSKTKRANHLSDINAVAQLFHELDAELANTSLQGLRNFNTAYLIITRNVYRQWQNKYFDYPDFLKQFDINFAGYYLRALEEYILHGQTVPAWQKVFEKAEQNHLSPLVLMALGVNAHVNNDIPQVLRDTSATSDYYNDFRKVNNVIKDSIYEVIDALDDRFGRLSPKQQLLKPFYKLVMNCLIKIWRQNAWYKFRKLQASELTKSSIEQSADSLARLIMRLPV